MNDDEQCLKEREVCMALGVSRQTLQRWRADGSGPPYFRLGRVLRYRRGDLRAWCAAQVQWPGEDSSEQTPTQTRESRS